MIMNILNVCFELSKETTYIVFELEITRFDCTVSNSQNFYDGLKKGVW